MINLWLVMRDDTKQIINTALSTSEDEYIGPVSLRERRIFEGLNDRSVQSIFGTPVISGNKYHMYSIYIKPKDTDQVVSAVAYLIEKYPNHIIIGGAWKVSDGSQDSYPPHNQLIRMMPDIWDRVAQQFILATELTDVNLLAGQAPRNFS